MAGAIQSAPVDQRSRDEASHEAMAVVAAPAGLHIILQDDEESRTQSIHQWEGTTAVVMSEVEATERRAGDEKASMAPQQGPTTRRSLRRSSHLSPCRAAPHGNHGSVAAMSLPSPRLPPQQTKAVTILIDVLVAMVALILTRVNIMAPSLLRIATRTRSVVMTPDTRSLTTTLTTHRHLAVATHTTMTQPSTVAHNHLAATTALNTAPTPPTPSTQLGSHQSSRAHPHMPATCMSATLRTLSSRAICLAAALSRIASRSKKSSVLSWSKWRRRLTMVPTLCL